MSKKNRGQITIQLEPDEACVVLEKKFWDHMIHWYTIMANDTVNPEEKGNWSSIINAVERWVEHTHYTPDLEAILLNDDEWDDV